MLKIKIAGRSFKIPIEWGDITLKQCSWLYEALNEQSEDVKDYYQSITDNEHPPKLPKDTKALGVFQSRVIQHLASIPQDLLDKTRSEDLEKIATLALPRFILGVMGYVDRPATTIKCFWHRARKYHLPKAGIDIGGNPTPLSEVSAIEGCQVSDLVMAQNITIAPLAIAMVCRRKGERYSEDLVLARAKEFESLPASIYWALWLQVSAAHNYFQGAFAASYGGKGGGGGVKSAMWSNTLVAMSIGKPSELQHLQQMPYYDFMHLLNERNKEKKDEWEMKAALASCRL